MTSMNSSLQSKILRRYTRIKILKDLLENKELQFSNLKKWSDKNDRSILEIHQKSIGKLAGTVGIIIGSLGFGI